MVKNTKGIQVSKELHERLKWEKFRLIQETKNINVTFEKAIDDLLYRSRLFHHIIVGLVVGRKRIGLTDEIEDKIKKLAKEHDEHLNVPGNAVEYIDRIINPPIIDLS